MLCTLYQCFEQCSSPACKILGYKSPILGDIWAQLLNVELPSFLLQIGSCLFSHSFMPSPFSPTITFEYCLSRSVRTTLAQLHSGHCRLLNSYKARITADVCPDSGVAPHFIEHLCPACLPAWYNWHLKTYGTIQTRWLIFSSLTTTDERGELWATTTTTTTHDSWLSIKHNF